MSINQEQFQNEVDYGAVILIVNEILKAGLINRAEYIKIERMYKEKYQPFWGGMRV